MDRASRYHLASLLLSRAAAGRKTKATSGTYRTAVEGVVGGLRERLLLFSALLLHRLVEERRFAILLTELTEGRAIHMTADPEIEDPDDEVGSGGLVRWSAKGLEKIRSAYGVRMAKTEGMAAELKNIADAFARAEPWLEEAVPIYARHMRRLDGISADEDSRERKAEDRRGLLDPKFNPKAPGMKWTRRNTFAKRPEANAWRIRQWANIYKHGPDAGSVRPMAMHRGNFGAAALLDHRMGEMMSSSAPAWSLAVAGGEGDEYPAFLDAAVNLLRACKSALTDDESLLAAEWEKIDDAARGGLSMSARKRKKKKGRWDWSEFANVKEKDPDERLDRQIRRYKRDRHGRFTK